MADWYPSRYGAEDRVGAANELTAERTLAALRIPRTGRVIELAQYTDPATPLIPPRAHHQLILAHESAGSSSWRGANSFSALQEQVVTSYHVGCHLDGLAHVGIAGRYYNGLSHDDVFAPTGVRQLGIENARPWLARGVLLDVAAALGHDRLASEHEIIASDLQAAAEHAGGITMGAGDAVLVHTGWAGVARDDPAAYAAREPGLGEQAARWLTDRRVSLVGVDNWGCDVYPNPDRQLFFPVHQQLLARTGTYILENIDTAELAASGAAEFLFVLTAHRTRGATAAMVAPIAVL